jgi:hypothetical protein
LIGTSVFYHLPHLALFIREVPKGEYAGGARLQTGGLDLSIPYLPFFVIGDSMGLFDPLNAERTFFHDPFAAYRDIRVQLEVKGSRPSPREPVEASHLIGAILRAESGTDTPVIDLIVQTFL